MKKDEAHIVRMPAHRIETEEPSEVLAHALPAIPEGLPSSSDFSYSKKLFLQRLVLQVVLLMLIVVLLSPLFLGISLLGSGAIVGLYAIFVVISSVSPFLTSHTLTPDHLILRQGWYFKTTIPTKDIDSVEKTEEYSKVGVKFALTRKRLYVTASRYGLVQIVLKEPKRFPLALGKKADEIVIDVERSSRFIELADYFLERYRTPIPASLDQSS
ncbi:MAG: PH domain-containing protein [Thermoplasmata archaeon]